MKDTASISPCRPSAAPAAAESGHDVQHSIGKTGLTGELGELECSQRGLLDRFDDELSSTASAELSFHAIQWEVSRHDGTDHTEWVPGSRCQRAVVARSDFVIALIDCLNIETESLDDHAHIHVDRVSHGFAQVPRAPATSSRSSFTSRARHRRLRTECHEEVVESTISCTRPPTVSTASLRRSNTERSTDVLITRADVTSRAEATGVSRAHEAV